MDFHTLCIGCRTYRRFKQKQIPEKVLDELLENARIANSAMNGQPLRYVLVKNPEAVRKIQPCFHFATALPKELGQPKEGEQPTAFIILCTEGPETPWTGIDIGIAVRTMNLNAYIYGIGSCIIGNAEFKKVKEILSVPETWNPRLALALGYPSHKSTIVELPEDSSLKYYLDEERQYYVPKRKQEDISIIR